MPNDPDIRWRQRLQSFRKAFSRLSDAVKLAGERKLSPLEQQGLIQAFEFEFQKRFNELEESDS